MGSTHKGIQIIIPLSRLDNNAAYPAAAVIMVGRMVKGEALRERRGALRTEEVDTCSAK